MLKEFIKPNKKNSLLTLYIFIFALGLGFLMFFMGIPIPKGFEILKIIFLPFQLISLFSLSPIFILPLIVVAILWIYLLACLLLYLKTVVTTTQWNAKKFIVLGVVFVLCFVVYGFFNFGWGDILIPTADDSGATVQGVNIITNANNQFSIDLYNEINKESNENIFFSPWSISTAVAMAYEGARGDTATEMQNVFYFPDDDSLRRSSYAKMLNTINKASGKYKLHTANAIWLQEDYPFLEDYKDTISRYYLGEIKNLDFGKNPSGSSSKINNWVSKNTNNKIKEIVSPSMFTDLTRAVLTNAIYFKGKWEHKFDRDDTKPEDFTLESGQSIKVPMMMLTDDDLDFNYVEADGIQILEMPYQGDKVSMLVLLPRTEISNQRYEREEIQPQLSDINQLQSILSAEKLQEWRSKMNPETVYVYMPKYTFETSYSLVDYLKDMGMSLPFIWPGADFSGMDGTKNLYIDKVLHKAYIDVYEEGTEAAAATALVMTFGSALPHFVEFRADHPFIFIIQERETGNILFMGRVNDPTLK
jgi:serpin B